MIVLNTIGALPAGFSGRQAQGQGQEQAAAQPAQQQGAGQPSGNPDDPEAGPRPSQGGSEAPPGEGGADGAQEGEAGGPQGQAQPKSLMQSGAPDKDIYQVAMVSYENSYTVRMKSGCREPCTASFCARCSNCKGAPQNVRRHAEVAVHPHRPHQTYRPVPHPHPLNHCSIEKKLLP